MANILFTWEIGDASGHIAPYVNLIRLLEKQGHRVFFAAKSLANVHRLLSDTQSIYVQAPNLQARSSDVLNPVDSYTKILNNSGYARADELCGLMRGWQALYTLCQPDLCLFDYSPTAILAARSCTFKKIQIGTGFFSPPDESPLTGLTQLQGAEQNRDDLAHFEQQLIAKVNWALHEAGLPAISNLFALQECDERIFLSFKELDHYPQRQDGNFIGVFRAPRGEVPPWPSGEGQRIFAYLKPSKGLEYLLRAIEERKHLTLVYPDHISAEIQKKYSSATVKFVDRPLDMRSVCEGADLAICNANHGTLCELLLGGVPMLLLPLHAEQNICARNVVSLGAGLSAPKLHGPSMVKKMDLLLSDPRYKRAAEQFARRYANFDQRDLNQTILGTINRLLD